MVIDRTRLAAARLIAGDAQPFLTLALWAMTPIEAPGLGTFGIDEKWRLYIDPLALERWSVRESAGVLLHEAGHVVRDHAGRARVVGVDESTKTQWNWAGDAEINDDLRSDLIRLPGDGVYPERLGLPTGKVAEYYFSELLRRGVDHLTIPDCGSGCHGVDSPDERRAKVEFANTAPGIDGAEAMLLRKRIAEAVVRLRGQQPGRDAGGWERWARALLNPQIDWKTLLRSRIRAAIGATRGASDYTYRIPARRRMPPVVLPALQQPLPSIAVVIDTSASMGDEHLNAAWTEVQGAVRSLGVRRDLLRVYAGDTAMQRIAAPTAKHVALTGGGGTDMRVGIAAAMRAQPKPGLVVVITDGYTPWPDTAPRARVVVALVGESESSPPVPSWATTVHVKIDDAADANSPT